MSSQPIKLSKRQKQILQLLVKGQNNQEIAAALDLSEHTIKVHFWRLFKRLGVHNRTAAIYYAQTHGLIAFAEPTDNDLIAIGQAAAHKNPAMVIDLTYARAVIDAMRGKFLAVA